MNARSEEQPRQRRVEGARRVRRGPEVGRGAGRGRVVLVSGGWNRDAGDVERWAANLGDALYGRLFGGVEVEEKAVMAVSTEPAVSVEAALSKEDAGEAIKAAMEADGLRRRKGIGKDGKRYVGNKGDEPALGDAPLSGDGPLLTMVAGRLRLARQSGIWVSLFNGRLVE